MHSNCREKKQKIFYCLSNKEFYFSTDYIQNLQIY